MNIHEYQARGLLKKYGAPVLAGGVAYTPHEAVDAAKELGKWRKKEGMSKLKGSGEGATIGAWRSICKKATQSTDLSSSTKQDGSDKPAVEERQPSPRRGKRRSITFVKEAPMRVPEGVHDVEEETRSTTSRRSRRTPVRFNDFVQGRNAKSSRSPERSSPSAAAAESEDTPSRKRRRTARS